MQETVAGCMSSKLDTGRNAFMGHLRAAASALAARQLPISVDASRSTVAFKIETMTKTVVVVAYRRVYMAPLGSLRLPLPSQVPVLVHGVQSSGPVRQPPTLAPFQGTIQDHLQVRAVVG